ncbi:cysteine desulfurase [Ectothiorhodospiraceae bacterium 2226]|nr:cysteine desulfurase [Ectothiorhodospiraceae bacterium 2226]
MSNLEALRHKDTAGAYDIERIRADFPGLSQEVRGKPLAYLDNAASAQKPQVVVDTVAHYLAYDYANVHRGVHYLAERATQAYEGAREKVRAFLNAADKREVVFVRGTTEAINLVAHSFGGAQLRAGDEILITELEHHANIVPWQLLAERTGVVIKVAPVNDAGELIMEGFEAQLSERTKLVSVAHMSNALGTILPVKRIIELAHATGAKVLIDGAQSVPHIPVDVQALGCDFYAFSGHKLYGPTGIGVLWARADILESMPPFMGGGEMIREVSFEKSTFAGIPLRFEAGTPDFVGAIGLGAAIDYVLDVGLDNIARHEHELLVYATEQMRAIPHLNIIGTAAEKGGIISFVFDDIHSHDVGTIIDMQGVAIRTGHHCAMPLMNRCHVPATSRASFGMYNTKDEVDRLVAALYKVREVFGQ